MAAWERVKETAATLAEANEDIEDLRRDPRYVAQLARYDQGAADLRRIIGELRELRRDLLARGFTEPEVNAFIAGPMLLGAMIQAGPQLLMIAIGQLDPAELTECARCKGSYPFALLESNAGFCDGCLREA